jgi:hypothetical protein
MKGRWKELLKDLGYTLGNEGVVWLQWIIIDQLNLPGLFQKNENEFIDINLFGVGRVNKQM